MSLYKSSLFIKSITDKKDIPQPYLSEVLFVGKSNVGKSSLINALTNNKKLAYTSSKPGHTRLLNYYLIENRFYFVDAPGYGFSQQKTVDYEFYGNMVDSYLTDNKNLKLIVFILDSRRIPNEDDILFYDYLVHKQLKFCIVLSKSDKLNMSEKARIKKNFSESKIDLTNNEVFLTSISNLKSLENLKEFIDKAVI